MKTPKLYFLDSLIVFALTRQADVFFWRSHDGLKVDLIVRADAKMYPIEIKLTSTPSLKHLEPLNRFKSLAGNDASETGLLVCRV
jgi:hypothetical protein